jgi:hypothetical protein
MISDTLILIMGMLLGAVSLELFWYKSRRKKFSVHPTPELLEALELPKPGCYPSYSTELCKTCLANEHCPIFLKIKNQKKVDLNEEE